MSDYLVFSKNVYFTLTRFKNANFKSTTFTQEGFFLKTLFAQDAYFNSANFLETSQISFRQTKFCGGVNFQKVICAGYITFEPEENTGNLFLDNEAVLEEKKYLKETLFARPDQEPFRKLAESIPENQEGVLDLQNARIENPERILFYRVLLRPNWFVNMDSRKIIFRDVHWTNFEDKSKNLGIATEIKSLIKREISEPNRLFVIDCRQLAENAENNNRFEEASNFRRMAFETEWLEMSDKSIEWFEKILNAKKEIESNFGYRKVDLLAPLKKALYIIRHFEFPHLFYRYFSYYGESWRRAAIVLAIAIFAFFPFIYTQTEFQVSPKNIPLQVIVKDCKDVVEELKPVCKIEIRGLNFWNGEAISHSLATATLQTVEYRIPLTRWGSFLTILEKIFAPLQAALLALAIRRKFMR